MRIEALELKNYKTFKHLKLTNLPAMVVLVGANGTGKTTLFDVFSFLQDALATNVTKAVNIRGKYKNLVTQGCEGESIELNLWVKDADCSIRYELAIQQSFGEMIVMAESFAHKTSVNCDKPQEWHIFNFKRGDTTQIIAPSSLKIATLPEHSTIPTDILGLKSYGYLEEHPYLQKFRKFIESWNRFDFQVDGTRFNLPRLSDEERFLSATGTNLANVILALKQSNPPIYTKIVEKAARLIPGVATVDVTVTEDERLLLKIQEKAFERPFYAKHVSEGTMAILAYLVLLNNPNQTGLLTLDEPENLLYPDILWELCEDLEWYARNRGQIFVSTHSPEVLNAVPPDSVYLLKKENGITHITKAMDDDNIKSMIDNGDFLMGSLWNSNLLASGLNEVS